MSDESLYYSIQEVSERLGIPIQKLRHWDTDGVLKLLREMGVQFGQGHLFQRPVPLDGSQDYSFAKDISAA